MQNSFLYITYKKNIIFIIDKRIMRIRRDHSTSVETKTIIGTVMILLKLFLKY